MQHHLLLQNILLPEKILNFFFFLVASGPSQSCIKEIQTVPKGFSLLMGCCERMWQNWNVEPEDHSSYPVVFLWALIRFDRLQCSAVCII